VVAVAAGEEHSLALRRDGTVVAWGAGASGATSVPRGLRDVVAVAAGGGWVGGDDETYESPELRGYSVAVTRDRRLVVWGSGAPPGLPTRVPPGLTQLLAGQHQVLAVDRRGRVLFWGQRPFGLPRRLGHVRTLATGGDHGLAVLPNGRVVGWGSDSWGEASPPVAPRDVVAVATAYQHSLALQRDGTVVGCGYKQAGAAVPTGLRDVVAIAAA
jgi:alpha-tubulin suppressor-like RCC1 family protein